MVGKNTRAYFHHQWFDMSPPGPLKRRKHRAGKTICIIRSNDSKEISQAAQGIVSALVQCMEHFCVISVVGDNNVMELMSLFYEVLYRYPEIDMIFSIGESSTRIAQHITQELNNNIPIFFILVGESTASYVIKQSNNVTGAIVSTRDYTAQFQSFFHFTQYDTTKKVIVPRSRFAHGLRAAYMDENGFDVISSLASYKIDVLLIDVTCREDLHTQVKPLLSDAGLLALPQDTVLDTYVNEFVEMANERCVPLFSSNFRAVEEGVGISFGRPNCQFSKGLALLAQPILTQNLHPSYVPAMKNSGWVGTLAINKEAAIQQGLKLNMKRVCADMSVTLV